VGDHDDRLLFRGGAAVAAPFHDVPVVEGFEVAVVAGSRPGAFDQDRLEMLVAVAGLAGVAFPGGFVVARADPGPGGQVGRVGKEPAISAGIFLAAAMLCGALIRGQPPKTPA
jgi:hypothetical protein